MFLAVQYNTNKYEYLLPYMLNDIYSILKNLPNRLLSLKLSDMIFYIEMKYVLTIITPATAQLLGIQNSNNKNHIIYKNERYHLIDLDLITACRSKRQSNVQYLILMDCGNKKAAFYVDQIVEFIVLNDKDLSLIKKDSKDREQDLFYELIYDDNNISVINLERVMELSNQFHSKRKYYNKEKKSEINV